MIKLDSPPDFKSPVNHATGRPASSHIDRSCICGEQNSDYFMQTNNYWSSTEYDSGNAWNWNFNNNDKNWNNKTNDNNVRCVRR